jgi:hypothetical protein
MAASIRTQNVPSNRWKVFGLDSGENWMGGKQHQKSHFPAFFLIGRCTTISTLNFFDFHPLNTGFKKKHYKIKKIFRSGCKKKSAIIQKIFF